MNTDSQTTWHLIIQITKTALYWYAGTLGIQNTCWECLFFQVEKVSFWGCYYDKFQMFLHFPRHHLQAFLNRWKQRGQLTPTELIICCRHQCFTLLCCSSLWVYMSAVSRQLHLVPWKTKSCLFHFWATLLFPKSLFDTLFFVLSAPLYTLFSSGLSCCHPSSNTKLS